MKKAPFATSKGKRRFTILLLVVVGLGLVSISLLQGGSQKVGAAAAQDSGSRDGVWKSVDPSSLPARPNGVAALKDYRTFSLNKNRLAEVLTAAPMEFNQKARDQKVELTLPMPDGSFSRFSIEQTSVMEPQLAAQYSNYKTYSAQGIDDPNATAKIDWTPYGFHAFVLTESGDVFVDPYSKTNTDNYISYFNHDSIQDGPFHCLVSEVNAGASAARLTRPERKFVSGPTLRTYRTAIAATAEYTAANGGTVNSALAALTTAVNRLNGIFERDVTVRFILVNNETNIIYTNAATDPYTNGNPDVMIGENQTNLDNNAVIGSANYDVGHVFGTIAGGGGSGLAVTPAVCQGNVKAQGASTATTTTGDSFVLGIVAHELAHQFSAQHSFNGSIDNCNQRTANSAYEPGSGSTIMSYTSACGAQNIQLNSDAYFHSNSINQMLTYIGTQSCQASVATGNTPPTINSGGNFTIPKNTPFALTASSNDVDGDAVTFTWEQLDLGPQSPPDTDADGNARPIFRSFIPAASPTRTFPRLQDILNNANVPPATYDCFFGTQCLTGEILPSIARVMNFQVTARDNRAGNGGVNSATMQLTVDGNSGPFVVTAPNTAVNWTGFTQQNVTWNVANTTNAPVNAANVKISLSTDGGNTFPTVLLASTPNTGTASVTVPNSPTAQARIKVEGVGNIFFDVSNTNFTIQGGVQPATTIQFASAAQNIAEAVGSATIVVNRSGDTTGASAVNYTTSDTAGNNLCSLINGQASSRCDYLLTLGTLSFAAGETSKSILIPIIDDVYAEGNENFSITLSNPTGATLGAQATNTLTITDNDAMNGVNPIDNASFFVRQHYVDFLNREPDAPGLAFWTNEITSCGANAQCVEVKRVNVSAAFFLSIEFQETGYLVYRTYKSGFGNLTVPAGSPVPVNFTDFLRDTQRIRQGVEVGVGNWQAQLEANKQAYMLAFVQRADFMAAYPNNMTATQFVDKLITNVGPGVISANERTSLINALTTNPSDVNNRATALRSVSEDSDLKTIETNRAFVLMQYFGYLRRNPFDFPDSNFDGYNFWLTKLNDFNGNFVNAEMVKAFISSIEYRTRFAP